MWSAYSDEPVEARLIRMEEERQIRQEEIKEYYKLKEHKYDHKPLINDYYPVDRPEDIALHLYK